MSTADSLDSWSHLSGDQVAHSFYRLARTDLLELDHPKEKSGTLFQCLWTAAYTAASCQRSGNENPHWLYYIVQYGTYVPCTWDRDLPVIPDCRDCDRAPSVPFPVGTSLTNVQPMNKPSVRKMESGHWWGAKVEWSQSLYGSHLNPFKQRCACRNYNLGLPNRPWWNATSTVIMRNHKRFSRLHEIA